MHAAQSSSVTMAEGCSLSLHRRVNGPVALIVAALPLLLLRVLTCLEIASSLVICDLVQANVGDQRMWQGNLESANLCLIAASLILIAKNSLAVSIQRDLVNQAAASRNEI